MWKAHSHHDDGTDKWDAFLLLGTGHKAEGVWCNVNSTTMGRVQHRAGPRSLSFTPNTIRGPSSAVGQGWVVLPSSPLILLKMLALQPKSMRCLVSWTILILFRTLSVEEAFAGTCVTRLQCLRTKHWRDRRLDCRFIHDLLFFPQLTIINWSCQVGYQACLILWSPRHGEVNANVVFNSWDLPACTKW